MITCFYFNNQGHDSFIDFLKAYAIIGVLIGHGIPVEWLGWIGYPIWGVQVQLFVLVQVFHSYKRVQTPIKWSPIIKRIILPFFLIELFIIGLLTFVGHVKCSPFGEGPGSYYPWIYLQFAIILPVIRPFFEKCNKYFIFIPFLLIAILLEIICAVFDLPENVYRLLCLRYLFLIPFGWLWVKEGVIINRVTGILSTIGLFAIIWFAYGNSDNEPFFYNTSWYNCHWICYFFVAWLGTYFLYRFWILISNSRLVNRIIRILAFCSYEIFLVQMALYTFYYPIARMVISNGYLVYIGTPLVMVLSILLGFKLKNLEERIFRSNKN